MSNRIKCKTCGSIHIEYCATLIKGYFTDDKVFYCNKCHKYFININEDKNN